MKIIQKTKQALAHGVKPFWWDTGGAPDRRNNTVKDQRTIDALWQGRNRNILIYLND